MKNTKLLFFVIMFFSISCGKKLDREEAKKQIIATSNYPEIKSYIIPKSYNKDEDSRGNGVTIVIGKEKKG